MKSQSAKKSAGCYELNFTEQEKMPDALPYKPRIFKQGLALVLIPLSVGTIVLLYLNQLWHSTHELAQIERKQSEILELMTETFKCWSVTSGSLFGVAVEKNASYEMTVLTTSPGIAFKFRTLKALSENLPEQRSNILKLEEIFQQEFSAFASLPRSSESGMDLDTIKTLPKTLGRIYQLRTQIKQILNHEWDELKIDGEKQSKSRHQMKMLAYTCTAGNFILALVLVWFFSRSISNRMKTLIQMSAQLPQAQLPEKVLEGNDELAYLSKVISETAGKLHEADLHRESIIGMVAHDMRSPLMAAQASIQMIEEQAYDFPDGAIELLEDSHNNLSAILKYVQVLLTVQKKNKIAEAEAILKADAVAAKSAIITDLSPNKSNASLFSAIADFFLRPKILQQGLVLVMGPLLLQTAFLLYINQQILNTETITEGEQRAADINIVFNLISMDTIRGATVYGIYLITQSPKVKKLSLKIFDEMRSQYEKLSALTGNDRKWKEFIQQSKTAADHQVEKFLAIQPGDTDTSSKFQALTDIAELKSRDPESFQIRQIGNFLFEENLSKLHHMELQQEELAAFTGRIFGWSIAANFILAFALLLYFVKNLNRRLTILIDNATALGQRKTLQSSISGSDEIAYLDLVLHQSKAQLELASQDRAMIMASLADEMRGPLQKASSDLERLDGLSKKSLSEKDKRNLNRAKSNISRVLNLVEDLLTMESLETGKVDLEISECNLFSIADDAIATVAVLAKKKEIRLTNSCTELRINADKARLVQVLVNYLSNAIKFSAEHTSIEIKSSLSPGLLRVSVIDQGPGMDQETRDRVFEKFFQANTEQKQQGFGLGLAICQLIVQSHGGKLGVDSEAGKGSSFWFELPIKANESRL